MGESHTLWLGLDIDDMMLAGDPLQVRGWVNGMPATSASACILWVSVFIADTGRPVLYKRMDLDGSVWTTTVDPLPAGVYRLVVEAVGVPYVGHLSCHDLFLVLHS